MFQKFKNKFLQNEVESEWGAFNSDTNNIGKAFIPPRHNVKYVKYSIDTNLKSLSKEVVVFGLKNITLTEIND